MPKNLLVVLVAAVALVAVPAAGAKRFRPGDLRVCNATRCVPILNPSALPHFSSFYGAGPQPLRARQPALGTPYYKLRFRNGYVTGIVARRRLDRFLSYGVNLERFMQDTWYRVPAEVSAELRRLTKGLRPLRLTRAALAKSR